MMLVNYDYNDPISDKDFLTNLLRRRDQELAATDWTQLADSPVDKVAWAAYRQGLRDLTLQKVKPQLIVIPVKP